MDVLKAIVERRSINFFEPGREVPDEKLRELLEAANLAPSSFNLQPWKVVVVRDPERKKALRGCALDQAKVEEASAVLIMVADPRALEENRERVLESWAGLGYLKPEMKETYSGLMDKLYGPPEGARRTVFAVKNTSLFAMSLMLAAKGMGLETHAMDGFDEDCVKKEFGIPADKTIPMLVAVGYLKPGTTLLPRAFRRKVEEFARFERYE
ncbi:MAG: nitroreductase family protein [Thermodesulfovibrionales bacterium]